MRIFLICTYLSLRERIKDRLLAQLLHRKGGEDDVDRMDPKRLENSFVRAFFAEHHTGNKRTANTP